MIRPVDAPVNQKFGANPTSTILPGSPDYWVIQKFGNYQPDGHAGEDYAVPVGTPIRAVAAGVVLHVGFYGGTYAQNPYWIAPNFAGYCYVIDHGSFIGIYAHGKDGGAKVGVGWTVGEGAIIGLSGNTGGSTGPHLHFEILPDGFNVRSRMYGRVDPSPYFKNATPAAAAGTITSQGTATTTEEDDMFSDQDRADVQRVKQLLESFQAAITDPVTGYVGHAALTILKGGAATQFVKGDADDTIFAREDNGVLRGITRPEWLVAEASGEKFTVMPQEYVDNAQKA